MIIANSVNFHIIGHMKANMMKNYFVDTNKILMNFSLRFPRIIKGAKSQIISTALRPDISMELLDAWIGARGISLSEHVSPHPRLDHVLSVRQTSFLYIKTFCIGKSSK